MQENSRFENVAHRLHRFTQIFLQEETERRELKIGVDSFFNAAVRCCDYFNEFINGTCGSAKHPPPIINRIPHDYGLHLLLDKGLHLRGQEWYLPYNLFSTRQPRC